MREAAVAPAPSPWEALKPQIRTALAHPGGIVGLSVGTPVDPVPEVVREALAAGGREPGYPPTQGTPRLRAAAVSALERRHGVTGLDPAAVLATVGSKEIVAALPGLLGLGRGDTVVVPGLAYPTYEAGARLAGADVVRAGPGPNLPATRGATLIWVNSPANPTGDVLAVRHLRALVAAARERGAVLASDECYLGLGWETRPLSVLHPDVCGGDHTGLLAVHSLSKTSNLAGYRAGFVAGDPVLVDRLLALRKQGGLMVPGPVQEAMVAALTDDAHVAVQRARYRARRAVLRAALERAGFRVDGSAAGLYLWATAGEDAWATVDRLAAHGVLVAPGTFYGPAGARHVRVALTATDERVAAAAERLDALDGA